MHADNLKYNLAPQEYWDEGYANYQLVESQDDDSIKQWIKKYLPTTNNHSCFEIGCFPGRYLTFLGRMGYELNGVDLTPRVLNDFPLWLQSLGLKTGEFLQQDFFTLGSARKYDVVCSFGFIEHFTNWEEVIVKHLSLVKSGGYVVIETPNFRGIIQRFIHYFLDHQNYKRHHIQAMSPGKWAKLCRKHGFEVVTSGYIGEFQFWVDRQPEKGWRKKVFDRLIRHYARLRKMPAGRKIYAPYCGIIAHLPLK